MKKIIRLNKNYFQLAMLLFIIQILIAKYAHDHFIRPYAGDFLVVILMYCLLKSFLSIPTLLGAISVLAFAFFVEFLQYLHLADTMGLVRGDIARTLLGDYFTWTDILMYALGITMVILCENLQWQFHPDIHKK